MKKLQNILLGAFILAMMACNDGATGDESTSDTSTSTTTNNNTTDTAAGGTLATADAQFLNDAAASNMAEVKMGQLAQQKGTSQDVKDIGKLMETDHSAGLSELRDLASRKSSILPGEEKEEDKNMHNMLNGKSGKEFDKEWCRHMIDAHQKVISKFEGAQNSLSDADLKTWVTNTLPKLRTHLDRLKECDSKLK